MKVLKPMKCCKQETFVYWCVHCFIWMVITLPTVIFLVRINHPRHHESSTKLNNTKDNGKTASMKDDIICTNYTKQRCEFVNSWSVSAKRNISLTNNEEIEHIFGVSFIKNHSLCRKLLREVLCVQKYSWCMLNDKKLIWRTSNSEDQHQQLVNSTREFCEQCSNYSHVWMNVSLEHETYIWLREVPCLSLDELFKENQTKNETPGRSYSDVNCTYPLVKDDNSTCRIPCDWSLMSSSLRDIFYALMVVNMWTAVIATVITVATLVSIRQMRVFPHIVRFYILICSALYATANLLPLRIGLAKVYCGEEKFWHQDGHTSRPAVIEGALTHYFFLAFCFWSLCYVANTYSVIVKYAQDIFVHRIKHHAIQFSLCFCLPALLVGTNMVAKRPGYKSLFLDRMTSVFTSPVLEYITFTLPVQVSLGVAISLLWSIIRFVRKIRKNKNTFEAIRPDEDVRGFINVEKQFTKLAILFIVTVAVVLCSELILTYGNEQYIHQVDEYFDCLKTSSSNCRKPKVQIFFLSSIKVTGPGFYCLINFFLLFFNADTRNTWKKWFGVCYNVSLCRWDKINGNDMNDAGNATRSRAFGTRERSATVDTVASINSLSRGSALRVSSSLSGQNKLNSLPSEIPLVSLRPPQECNVPNSKLTLSHEEEPSTPQTVRKSLLSDQPS